MSSIDLSNRTPKQVQTQLAMIPEDRSRVNIPFLQALIARAEEIQAVDDCGELFDQRLQRAKVVLAELKPKKRPKLEIVAKVA